MDDDDDDDDDGDDYDYDYDYDDDNDDDDYDCDDCYDNDDCYNNNDDDDDDDVGDDQGPSCRDCMKLPGCQHGDCTKSFTCHCEPGWSGMFCNVAECESISQSEPSITLTDQSQATRSAARTTGRAWPRGSARARRATGARSARSAPRPPAVCTDPAVSRCSVSVQPIRDQLLTNHSLVLH